MAEKRLSVDQVPVTGGGGGITGTGFAAFGRLKVDANFAPGGAFIPIPGTDFTFNLTSPGNVFLAYSCFWSGNTSLPSVSTGLFVDGVPFTLNVDALQIGAGSDRAFDFGHAGSMTVALGAGNHTIQLGAGGNMTLIAAPSSPMTTSAMVPTAITGGGGGGGGGSGGGGAALVTVEVENPGSFPSPGPVGSWIDIPGTTITFTLDEQKSVLFAGVGTSQLTGGTRIMSSFGVKIDGVVYDGTQLNSGANGVNDGGQSVVKSLLLAAGVHTANLTIRKDNALETGASIIDMRLIATYTQPVFGVGSLSQLEAIANLGGNFQTAQTAPNWSLVPNTQINFTLLANQVVLFEGSGTALSDIAGKADCQIGINVDGVDFPGTHVNSNVAAGLDQAGLFVFKAASLAAGPHTAQLEIRRVSGNAANAIISTDSVRPARLSIVMTDPTQLTAPLPSNNNPSVINSGDLPTPGVALDVSRSDHVHGVNTAIITDLSAQVVGAGSPGISVKLPRADHVHPMTSATPPPVGTGNAEGVSPNVARADHVHQGVHSIAGGVNPALNGDVTIAAGTNVQVTEVGQTITVAVGPQGPGSGLNADMVDGKHATDLILVDGTQPFTGDQSMGTHKLTALAAPTNPTDAANKAYVDAQSQGLDIKDSVRVATTVALPSATYNNGTAGVGAQLVGTVNGALPAIDSVTLVVNDRLLVKDQVAGLQNGIYFVAQVGDAGSPFILTRATDADSSTSTPPKVESGMFTFVEEGSTFDNSGFVLATANPIVMGTTALSFSQFSGAGQVVAGAGLTKTGNTLNVVGNPDGSIIANADDVQVGVLATDAQHGLRGNGGLHQPATTLLDGFMSAADKTKLNGIATGATDTPLSNANPTQVFSAATAAPGVATDASRSDHQHPVNTALVADIATVGTKAAGSSPTLARGDHVHDISTSIAAATADTTFSNAADTLVNSMTLTPGAGTYLVWFQGSSESDNAADQMFPSIYSNGVQVAASERKIDVKGANKSECFSCMATVTVAAAQAIEGRMRNNGVNTVTVHQRQLMIQKVG